MPNERIYDLDFALSKCRGGHARFWDYTSSLGQLTLRIEWLDQEGNIHIVCNGCERVEASHSWSEVDLSIGRDGDHLVLSDLRGNLKVVCQLIRAFVDVEPIYKLGPA